MQTVLRWSKRIPAESRLIDPLGIGWHLEIQTEFTFGITSVTNRLRYFTMLAWYRTNFSEFDLSEEKKQLYHLERFMILSSLQHHNGNRKDPLLKNLFNKTRFENEWNRRNSFPLDNAFKISVSTSFFPPSTGIKRMTS